MECDASRNRIGVVLMQEGRSLSFECCEIKGEYLQKLIYGKEILEILHALKQWRPYLIEINFKVKTDHGSLKYFLCNTPSFYGFILTIEQVQRGEWTLMENYYVDLFY